MEHFLKNIKIVINKKEFKNLLPLLVNFYISFLGISWIILHIYVRFFIERPTYLLLDLKIHNHYINKAFEDIIHQYK